MHLMRPPVSPRLRTLVQTLWASVPDSDAVCTPGAREHVLPTGAMHLVFRLSGPPLRVFADKHDLAGKSIGHALVGGARSRYYLRDTSVPSASVGALLRPGAALWLLGAPEGELAGRHTMLDALWGQLAAEWMERLQSAPSLAERLNAYERLLIDRLNGRPGNPHGMHPAVAQALASMRQISLPVQSLVASSGYSHRHFIGLFRRATGLTPKAYARVQRLDDVLSLGADPTQSWSQIALATGFSDQAHLTREFGDVAGLSPQAWRQATLQSARHVPR